MARKSKLLGNENHPGKGNPHLDQDGVPGQGVPSILGGIPPGLYQEGGVGPGGIPGLLGDPPGLFEPEPVDITAPDSLNMEAGEEETFDVTVENPEFSPEYDAVYFDFTIEGIDVEDISLEYQADGDWLEISNLKQDGDDVTGRFGPADGFELGSDYEETTTFRATIHQPGEYDAAIDLYDVEADELLGFEEDMNMTVANTIVEEGDSIQDAVAVDTAEQGDFILVENGIYAEDVTIDGVNNLTLMGDEGAVINGEVRIGDPSDPAGSNDTTFMGFGLAGVESQNERGIGITQSDNVVIEDNHIGNFTTGVSLDFAGQAPTNVSIEGNTFSNNVAGIGSTEDVQGLTIVDNSFADNDEAIGLGAGAGDILIEGNTFSGHGYAIGIWGYDMSDVEIGVDQFRTEDELAPNQILGNGHDLGNDLDPSGFSVDEDGVVTEVTDPENMVLSWDDANPDTNWDDLQITLTGVQEGDDLSTLFGAMPG
jgi:hypothetical protein